MDLILKIFYSPNNALREIKEKKPIILPFIILLLISLFVSFLYIKFILIPNKEIIFMSKNLPPEAYEKSLEFIGSPFFYIFTLFSGILGFFFSTLIIAFIFFLVSLIIKGKSDFIAFWSASVHISAISLLGSIVAFPIALLRGSPDIRFDFSILFTFLSEKNFLRVFLENTNFFTLWALFLYGLALFYIGEIEKKKSIIISYSLWFIYSILITLIKVLRG